MAKQSDTTKELLKYIDVVVDGKFEEDKKDLKLKFRGSSNQRILDVKESLKKINSRIQALRETSNILILETEKKDFQRTALMF